MRGTYSRADQISHLRFFLWKGLLVPILIFSLVLTTLNSNLWHTWCFHLSNHKLPFLSSNIPCAPLNCVNISQLIRYVRACFYYTDFIDSGMLLTQKNLRVKYAEERLTLTIHTVYGHLYKWVIWYYVSLSNINWACFYGFTIFGYQYLICIFTYHQL